MAPEARGTNMLTQPDLVAGTPAYLAPEIALGGDVDGRADLYSLGCVAYWLLTGSLVFEAATAAAMLVAHVRETPSRPSSLAAFPVPDAMDQLVIECLAKDPAARPRSADALAERLAAVSFARSWTPDAAEAWWVANRLPVGRGSV